jgi:class 3 adenylate cyclase
MPTKTQALTILFCDLAASTERRARLGDDAYDEFSARYLGMLRRAIAEHGGREVSNAGDGLMVVFTESVVAAVACAMEMHAGMPALDADDPPKLYVGISTGEVAQDGDNYSGMPIVEAARLESAAAPGQTLANSVVRALVGTRRLIRFRDVGQLTLKGIPEPLATVEIVTEDEVVPPATPEAPRPKRKRGLFVALAVVVVLVVIAGAVALVTRGRDSHTAAGNAPPPAAPRNYPVQLTAAKCPADIGSQVSGLTCSTLTVPEDRSKPNGRVVKLGVYHAPARTKPAEADPVVDFGADDIGTSPVREHRDEYLLAQRGWGGEPGSTPELKCPEFTDIAGAALTKPSGDPAQQELGSAAFQKCHDRLSKTVDLSQYNYLTNGDDMADLIRALHLSHVNLVSGYVETIAALEVTRQLPGVVRTLTLQDVVPGGRSRYSDPTATLSKAFNNYVALCRKNAACNKAYPDLPGALRRDYQMYNAKPGIAHGDDGSGHTHDVLLDGPRISIAIYAALSDPSDYGLLAAAIASPDRTSSGDNLTAGRVMLYYRAWIDPTFDWGAQLSGMCSYDQYTLDGGRTLSDGAVPELAGADDGFPSWACPAWKVDKIAQVAFDDDHSDIPMLVVNGDLAQNADQSWPQMFQQLHPQAIVADFPTLNAFLLSSNVPPCLGDLRRHFLDNPSAPLDVAECTRQSPPIQFVAGG